MKNINFNKIKKYLLVFFLFIFGNALILYGINFDNTKNIKIQYSLKSEKNDTFEVYWKNNGEDWTPQNSSTEKSEGAGVMKFDIPTQSEQIRLDLGNTDGVIEVYNFKLTHLGKEIDINDNIENLLESNYIEKIDSNGNEFEFYSNGTDPFIVINISNINKDSLFANDKYINYAIKIIACLIYSSILYVFFKKGKAIIELFREILRNRTLLWGLAKNDFKTRYAGSYLGVFWAFVQPIITVLIYWFVFQVGFKSAPMNNFPYVLWLISGIVPWFFFSEALMSATNSLIEYSYLVKKVVFKISILPVVKIFSALFVHIFFVCFTIIVYAMNGFLPTIYSIQIIYYSACALVLALGISYATSAMVLFFKDLGQIINIIMQIGIWMTPIMWNENMVGENYRWILKINPMYYVVQGYRDAFINHVWLWQRFNLTVYFWFSTIVLFFIGIMVFKKLKPHFSDVL